MLKTSFPSMTALGVTLLVAGCGSGGNGGSSTTARTAPSKPLTRAEYKQRLHSVAAREAAAQQSVQKGLRAASLPRLRKVLAGFVADQRSVAQELAGLQPPKDASTANRQLAKAFADNAAATQQALAGIRHAATTKAALARLEGSAAARRSGQEIDGALGRLKNLGYTPGS